MCQNCIGAICLNELKSLLLFVQKGFVLQENFLPNAPKLLLSFHVSIRQKFTIETGRQAE
jgi:hypothetical protein